MKFFSFFVLSSFLVCSVAAQSALSPEQTSFIKAICERDVPAGAPGVACGIVKDGKIVFRSYSGFANLEDSVLISSRSRFNIASNAKQYTALAILQLVEAGNLSLDAELRSFFPGIQYPMPVTIRHLLTHTSGIRDVYDLWSLQGITWWKNTFSNRDAIDLLRKQTDLNFLPGEQYLYSNSNYILLAQIVEQVSRQTFQAYTNTLFQELGMKNTAFEADHTQIAEPIAHPYFNFNTWSTYDWKWDAVGDGNLFTTLEDQLRWEQIIQNPQLLPSWRKIISLSQEKVPGVEAFDYGYGLEFGSFRSDTVVFHHGSTGAWEATFLRFPLKKLTIMTISNSGKTTVVPQNEAVADYLLLKQDDPTTTFLTAPEKEGAYLAEQEIAGIYQSNFRTIFRFENREDGLYLIREGRNDVLLERIGDNIWQQVYDPAFKQAFTRDNSGDLEVTVYYTTHAPYSLTKVETNWSNFSFDVLDGQYYNTETRVTMEVHYQGDQIYEVKIGDRKREGLLLSPEQMSVGGYQLRRIQSAGKDGFLLDGNRIRSVYFQRKP